MTVPHGEDDNNKRKSSFQAQLGMFIVLSFPIFSPSISSQPSPVTILLFRLHRLYCLGISQHLHSLQPITVQRSKEEQCSKYYSSPTASMHIKPDHRWHFKYKHKKTNAEQNI